VLHCVCAAVEIGVQFICSVMVVVECYEAKQLYSCFCRVLLRLEGCGHTSQDWLAAKINMLKENIQSIAFEPVTQGI
jgi:hypothetical protein